MASEKTIEASQTNAPQTEKSEEKGGYFLTGDLAADQSLINTLTKIVPINELKEKAPFKDLFPISDKVYGEILVSMKEDGYNPLYPIYFWEHDDEKNCVGRPYTPACGQRSRIEGGSCHRLRFRG